MKKIIIYVLLLSLTTAVFSQEMLQKIHSFQTDYLSIYKSPETIAWILPGISVTIELNK